MNPGRTCTFTRRQTGIFKVSLSASGIAIGALRPEWFFGALTVLVVIAMLTGACVAHVTLKQH